MCRPMSIDEFLHENGEAGDKEDLCIEDEEDELEAMFQDGNTDQEENFESNAGVTKGASNKRTRGPTQCLKTHARATEDRPEVTLDDAGEAIGPTDEIVNDLSSFLGTLARNSDFCPLTFTNFKALPTDYRDRIWEYVTSKFIIPEEGKKSVFCCINEAWRRYKCRIKSEHFLKYSSLRERLRHRPTMIPEPHFRQLMSYWSNTTVQDISKKNAVNRTKQKYMHRMGPKNFARVRNELRVQKENEEDVCQAEMFIVTRQSRKGKNVDPETNTVVDKLKDSLQNSTEAAGQTFQSIFGKEKPGRVRCFGRTITPTMLKKIKKLLLSRKNVLGRLIGCLRRSKD